MRLCANFLWCVPSRWIENACFILTITASKRCNVLFDFYLFEARFHYFVFLSLPRLPHVPNSSPVVTSVLVLRLVARPDREFSRRIYDKCRKFLHKQLKEICPKARKCSKVNVPLFQNIPQKFPCSLKVILKNPLFPKNKWLRSLVP